MPTTSLKKKQRSKRSSQQPKANISSHLQQWVVPIDSVKLLKKNPRKHTQKDIRVIQNSLQKFSQITPIVIDKTRSIRKGNGTYLAAKQLGWDSIAAIPTELAGKLLDEYTITDNRASELSEWDWSVLSSAFKDNSNASWASLGWDAWELSKASSGEWSFLNDNAESEQKSFDPSYLRIPIDSLKPHPLNYYEHPEDQIEHFIASIEENGIFRNIVVAQDNTILAGHGLVEAAKRLNNTHVMAKKLNIEPQSAQAIKILIGDNELDHLAQIDDRALSELLKKLKDESSLQGTGYDSRMLANLIFVTRPETEIADVDKAALWAGLPKYEDNSSPFFKEVHIIVETEQGLADLLKKLSVEQKHYRTQSKVVSFRYPLREKDDVKHLRWVKKNASEIPDICTDKRQK